MSEALSKYVQDVAEFDEHFDLEGTTEANVGNLAFVSLALNGEVGELCNVVKKIWRDGETPELREDLEEEVVDTLIYLTKLVKIIDMDLDKVWDEKHAELYRRWENNPDKYRHGYNPVEAASTELNNGGE